MTVEDLQTNRRGDLLTPSLGPRPVRRWRRLITADSVVIPLVVALMGALVVLPLGFLVYGSVRSGSPGAPETTFTWENWSGILRSDGFVMLRNSLFLGLVTAVGCVVLGVMLAWFIVRSDLPGRRYFSSLLLLPLLFSPILTTLAWIGLAGPRAGLLNSFLDRLVGDSGPRLNIFSFFGMAMVLILHYTPYVYLAVRASLVNVDSDLEDASMLLGAGLRETVRRITLPVVAPAILSSGLLVTILAAENFTVPSLLGVNFGYKTIPYGVYESLHGFPSNAPRGAALGLLLLAISLIGMFFYLRTLRSSRKFVTLSGKGSKARVTQLNRKGRTVGLCLVLGYLLLGVGIPYVTLVYGSMLKYFATQDISWGLFSLEHYRALANDPQFLSAMQATVTMIVVGATVATVLSAFLAWVSARSSSRVRRVIDYMASLPIMVPGIALGVGMLWAYVRVPTGLYGSVTLLIIAVVTHYIGHGNRIAGSAIIQINPELEEAARTLGSSRIRTFFGIAVSMLRAPLASAWVLIAIFISIEVSCSIMLYTGRSMPMAVFVYLSMAGGSVSQAFAAGAVLATVTLVIVAIAQWRLRVLEQL